MAEIKFVPEAAEDFIGLDGSVRTQVIAAIAKLKVDARGYGDPLGNKCGIDLFGFFSIRAGQRIRIVYSVGDDGTVVIRVIGKRDRFEVHKTAEARIREYTEATVDVLRDLQDVLKAAAGDR